MIGEFGYRADTIPASLSEEEKLKIVQNLKTEGYQPTMTGIYALETSGLSTEALYRQIQAGHNNERLESRNIIMGPAVLDGQLWPGDSLTIYERE